MRRLLTRDLVILAAAVLVWTLTGGESSQWAQWLAGLLLVACAYLFHEWAHLLAARAVGAHVTLATSLFSPFLFSFSASANTRRQFLIMSAGGFAATAVFVAVYSLVMDDSLREVVALYGAYALATLTVVIEGPIFLTVAFGRPIPKATELF